MRCIMKTAGHFLFARSFCLAVTLTAVTILAGCEADVSTEPPAGQIDKTSLDFGPLFVGQALDRSFTLRNDGGGDLTGTMGEACSEFTIVAGGGSYSLARGEALEVTVRFLPTSAGGKACIISPGNSSLRSVSCIGTGVEIPTGACCSPDGSCSLTTEASCDAERTVAWRRHDLRSESVPAADRRLLRPRRLLHHDDGSLVRRGERVARRRLDLRPESVPAAGGRLLRPRRFLLVDDGSLVRRGPHVARCRHDLRPESVPAADRRLLRPRRLLLDDDGSLVRAGPHVAWRRHDLRPESVPAADRRLLRPRRRLLGHDGGTCVTERAWLGAATICDPNPCPQPAGACCAPDGVLLGDDGGHVRRGARMARRRHDLQSESVPAADGRLLRPRRLLHRHDGGRAPRRARGYGAARSAIRILARSRPAPAAPSTASCSVTTEAYVRRGARVARRRTVCDPNPCPQPTGACCTIDGACALTVEADCGLPSPWQGPSATCAPSPCPQPTGACCTQSGICSVTTDADCAEIWTMFGLCNPNPCGQPAGSCCAPSGACSVTTQANCGGAWTIFGDCSPNPCPQPTGACCSQAGTCSRDDPGRVLQSERLAGRRHRLLARTPALQPTGACCTPSGTCTVATQACMRLAERLARGRDRLLPEPLPAADRRLLHAVGNLHRHGPGLVPLPQRLARARERSARPNPCPQPTGACCAPSGNCTVVAQASCLTPNVYQGAGTVCSPNPCLPTGACCTTCGHLHGDDRGRVRRAERLAGCRHGLLAEPLPAADRRLLHALGDLHRRRPRPSCLSPDAYQGAETTCAPNPCQPAGACCTPVGDVHRAAAVLMPCSERLSGAPARSARRTLARSRPARAARPSGTCSVVTQASCSSPNVFQGAGTDCSPNPCPPPAITVSPVSIPGGTLGAAYNQTFTASGGIAPYTFVVSAGALPPDLSLTTGGLLSGTLTGAGSFSFTIQATDAASHTGSRGYTLSVTASGLDLTVPVVYITQSTQTQSFDVPLVKDRNGFLRAFVVASESNSATPSVRVRIYDGGSLLQTNTIPAPGSSVPTSIDESSLSRSWNVAISGTLIQPGNSMQVDVDPTSQVPETDESNNEWPSPGTPSTSTCGTCPF